MAERKAVTLPPLPWTIAEGPDPVIFSDGCPILTVWNKHNNSHNAVAQVVRASLEMYDLLSDMDAYLEGHPDLITPEYARDVVVDILPRMRAVLAKARGATE